MGNSLSDLLTAHGVRPTANRILVARELQAAGRPMTLSELEDAIPSIDKSGIFRTLAAFREHALVHVIENGGEGLRYELCLSHDEDRDDDLHAHFFCEVCHRTYCLHDVPVPEPQGVPGGYSVRSSSYILKGVCPDCTAKAQFATRL